MTKNRNITLCMKCSDMWKYRDGPRSHALCRVASGAEPGAMESMGYRTVNDKDTALELAAFEYMDVPEGCGMRDAQLVWKTIREL